MKKKLTFLLVLTVLFTLNVSNVSAKEKFYQVDSDLNIEEKFDSSVFFAGETVTSRAKVDGISAVAGNDVEIAGTSDYGVTVANTLKITGNIKNDLFGAGSSIKIDNDANIERDTYLAASSISIANAKFGRNVRMTAGTVTLNDVIITGDVYISATTIDLGNNVVINGKLSYNENAVINGLENNKINNIVTYTDMNIKEFSILDKVKNKLFSIVSGFIILTIMFLVFPSLFKKIDKKLDGKKTGDYLSKAGIGFIGLIMIPIVSIISIFTVVCIPIGFILIAGYVLSLYIGTLLTAYVVGKKIHVSMLKNEYNSYAVALLGLMIMKFLELVPILSVIVIMFNLLFGLGLIICMFVRDKK
jgi:hypothetical protein